MVTDALIAGLGAFNDGPTALGNSTTLTVTLTAGTHVSYTWDFGDGHGPTRDYASANGIGLNIPDNGCDIGTYLEHTIYVPTWAYVLDTDVTIGDLRHTWDDDVHLYLQAPDGTEVALSTGNGGAGDDYYNTVFDDEASTAITDGVPPFTGRFRPEGALATFDGHNQQGDWTLRVCDSGVGTTGVLNAWQLTITATTPSADGVISHTYSAPGVYPAKVTARNSVGTATAMTKVTISMASPICTAVTDVDMHLVTLGTIYTDTLVTFHVDIAPDNISKPYTYTIDYDDGTLLAPRTSSADPLVLTHTFAATGTYSVEIAVWNCTPTATVTDTATVWVRERGAPPASIDAIALTGPRNGLVDETYTFTATVSPFTVTTPITYQWRMTNDEWRMITHTKGLQDTAIISWTEAGIHAIIVTGTNATSSVSATHAITISAPPAPDCPYPLRSINIQGPSMIYTGTQTTFTGHPVPLTPTSPITYTWTPIPLRGQSTLTATYRWPTPGPHTLTLRAENCAPPDTVAITTTHRITVRPRVMGDAEPNDACAQATFIPTDGTVQVYAFQDAGDEDWVAFYATAGLTHVIEARVPPTSPADIVLELYDSCSPQGNFDGEDPTFNPDIRFNFVPPASGLYYLRLYNYDPNVHGDTVAYHLSVQAFEGIVPSGAIILVAGRYREGDDLQSNIHHVTNGLYQQALAQGCTVDQVTYLAAEPQPGSTGAATLANLEQAITQWAPAHIGPDRALTLYVMDHGRYDGLYLDGKAEVLDPQSLDGWLNELEQAVPGVRVNVLLEACYSGSFIDPAQRVSRGERLVIASTSAQAVAYASEEGAVFSDAFLNAVSQGLNLWTAFDEGVWAVAQVPQSPLPHRTQVPWLDDTGNGVQNETGVDGQRARRRLFACQATPPQENWPPHIVRAEVRNRIGNQGDIWAQAQDDKGVDGMWAVVYPPSWRPAEPGEELAVPPKRILLPPGSDGYGGQYTFAETGQYRIVLHAEDNESLLARPRELVVTLGGPTVGPENSLHFEIPIAGYTTTVAIPAEAVTATTTFTYTGFTDLGPSAPSISDLRMTDLRFAGRGFDLTAYQWGRPQPGFAFQRPITFTVRYSDADVAGLDESTLALYYYDGDTWSQDGLSAAAHFTATNELVVTAAHLSTFGLFGKAPVKSNPRVFLPLVLRK
jgi:subtilisin-like proprotein convertase family protein